MYCSYYGISEKPFSITPDPKYLYLGRTHKEAFAHLVYGIRERGGFIVITGEIGTGKTTLCRSLLNHLDADTLVAFIFNPTLSALELLKSINEDFGIRSQAGSQKELIDELNRFLLEKRQDGKNMVLIIDEAQNLDMEVLEHIRLLSNLETDTEKMLQIILIGQPEFRRMLEAPKLLQLNQRVTVRYHLSPLTREETAAYIHHRLSVAGAEDKVRFSPGAVKRIFHYTKGVPRLINVLCDRALLAGLRLLGASTDIVADPGQRIRPSTVPCFTELDGGAIVAGEQKLVGSAQLRDRGVILQHGSLLLTGDQSPTVELLRVKSPEDFPALATALDTLLDHLPTWSELVDSLVDGFERVLGIQFEEYVLGPAETARATELARHFADPTWTWRL